MAENAPDVQDITPDDFMGDEQVAPKAEPSTAEDKKPGADKPTEPAQGKDAPAEPAASEVADKPESEADKPTEPLNKAADERKNQLNAEIRDLVSRRNSLREEVARANSEVYQPATEDELVKDGMSATDAKVEALRQRIEMRDFNDQVAEAQLTIESESQRILNDFPIFNSNSDQFDEELSNEAATLLQANLIRDPNSGQIIGSNVSPYQLYKTLAKASGISAVKGQIKGQQATERMLANADNASPAAPAKKPADPLASLWAEDL